MDCYSYSPRLHPLLPLLLTAVAVPHLIAEEHYSRRTYQAMIRQARPAREMDYCGRLATQPTSAKEVRVFGLSGFLIRRFQMQFTAALGEMGGIRYAQLRVTGVLGALYALTLAGGFWYVAAQAGAGRLTLGDVVLYLGAVIQVELLTSNLTNGIGHLYQALLPLQRLFEFWIGRGQRLSWRHRGRAMKHQLPAEPRSNCARWAFAIRRARKPYSMT